MIVQSLKNIIAAIIISTSVYLTWTIILPDYNYTSSIKVEIQRRTEVLAKRKDIFKMNTDLNNSYQERYAEISRLALIVPAGRSLPEFVSTIEAMASQSGAIMSTLKIDGGKGEDLFNMIGFEVNMTASYDSILNFLTLVEHNLRIIDVKLISIGDIPGEKTAGFLNVQIKASTYYVNPLIEPKEEKQASFESF